MLLKMENSDAENSNAYSNNEEFKLDEI